MSLKFNINCVDGSAILALLKRNDKPVKLRKMAKYWQLKPPYNNFDYIMKLEKIQDIEKLPSVLDIEEVSLRLVELVDVIRSNNTCPLESAEAINDLISYQGYNDTGLSVRASEVVLNWIKEVYNPLHKELIGYCIANLANLTCAEAKDFLQERLGLALTDAEREDIKEALREIKT